MKVRKMLKKYLKQYWILLLIAIILVIVQVVSMLCQPRFISEIINALNNVNDLGEVNPNISLIYKYGMYLLIVGVIGLISGLINTFIAAYVSQNIGANLRHDSFKNIQNFAYEDIEKFNSSTLLVRLTNDITQIQNFIMLAIQLLIKVPFIFIGSFIMAINVLPSLWWTIILYIIIVIIITGILLKSMKPKIVEIQKSNDMLNKIVKENMDGIRVVKSFSGEKKEALRYNKYVDNLTSNLIGVGKSFSFMIPLYMLVANLITAFAIYSIANLAVDDLSKIGDLISFTTYMMQIMFALVAAGFISMSMARAIVSIKRVSEILKYNSSFSYGEEELYNFESLEFKNVDFAYPNTDKLTLKNISFKINNGEKLGIVGITGSGKSSIVQLIPRLYDVTNGEILINGKNIKEYNSKTLTNNIAIVLQKALLFAGTIEDNILHGNPAASNEEINQAAKFAQAKEFIDKKDNKYHAKVYQKGANLSGGQKQRLSIARAIVKEAQILILDDSTSALDAHSENLVKQAINNDLKNTTTIIVAQKISSIVDMNKILVLNEGTIEKIGTHEQLLKSSDTYQKIFKTQQDTGGIDNEE